MIENEKKINFFETKGEFLRKIENIEKQIQGMKLALTRLELIEINRLVKEIDFHNYEKKYDISPFFLFSSIFGSEKALRILLRNGMIKKQKHCLT